MIHSTHESSRIRNMALSALHHIAADQLCEVSDILALLRTEQNSGPVTRRIVSVAQPDGSVKSVQTIPPSQPKPTSLRTAACAPAAQAAAALPDGGSETSSLVDPPSGLKTRIRGNKRSDVVLEINKDHPEWPVEMLAHETGFPRGTISSALSGAQIIVPTKAQYVAKYAGRGVVDPAIEVLRKGTNRDRLRIAHAEHPDWTVVEMAAYLGLEQNQAGIVARHVGVKLPRPAVAAALTTQTKAQKVATELKAAVQAATVVPAENTAPTPIKAAAVAPLPAHNFTGRADLVSHYKDVGKRLGK